MFKKVISESFKWSWAFYCSSFTGIIGAFFFFKERLIIEKVWQILLFGFVLFVLTICIRIVLLLLIYRWRNRKQNMMSFRGFPIMDEINRCGLVDIEERNDTERELPPEKIFELPTREYFILSISAFRTFDKRMKDIIGLLERKIRVNVLLLNPKSEIVPLIRANEGNDIESEIKSTIAMIKSNGLYDKENFKVKFYDYMPPYLAVMVDGEIDPRGGVVEDSQGQIRIQPCYKYSSIHDGLIIHFKKSKSEKSIFKYFSGDLRIQWKNANPMPEYFN